MIDKESPSAILVERMATEFWMEVVRDMEHKSVSQLQEMFKSVGTFIPTSQILEIMKFRYSSGSKSILYIADDIRKTYKDEDSKLKQAVAKQISDFIYKHIQNDRSK